MICTDTAGGGSGHSERCSRSRPRKGTTAYSHAAAAERGRTLVEKITVIIPVWNGERTLAACLDSLAAQEEKDFRILIIDDGSTDGSVRVAGEWAGRHPETAIRIETGPNRGAAEARNTGIDLAETAYLTFMDQDDQIAPAYLGHYLRALEESGADVVCGGYDRVVQTAETGTTAGTERRNRSGQAAGANGTGQRNRQASGKVIRRVCPGTERWARFTVTAPWAHGFRTAFLKEKGVRFLRTGIGEDIYFILAAYAAAEKVVTIPDTGYRWIDNPDSLSNSRQKQVRPEADPFLLMNRLWEDLPEEDQSGAAESGGGITRAEKEYFLIRYGVWYLLFTLRETERALWQEQFDRITGWLTERIPDFARHPMISLLGPKGEPFGIRLSVWGFAALYRLGLARGLLGRFCR